MCIRDREEQGVPTHFVRELSDREALVKKVTIGVDSLGYLSADSVTKLAECGEGFCTGCFTGEYPIEVPEKKAKFRFERGLSERE